jgi:hypothetical protein
MAETQTVQGAPRKDDPIEALVAPMRPLVPRSFELRVLLVALLVLSLWALAIATFGVPALVWPMKMIVPGCVVMLVVLTQGM